MMKNENILYKVSYYLILLLVVSLPIFFLPFASVTLSSTKIMLFYFVAISLGIAFLLNIAETRKLFVLNNGVAFSVGGILVTSLISALFSGGWQYSVFGIGFQASTWIFIFMSFFLGFIVSVTFDNSRKIYTLLFSLLIPFFLISAFHLIRIFMGPQLFFFGLFGTTIDSVLGVFSDLSIFYGFFAILSLSILEGFSFGKLWDFLLYFTLLFSISALVVFNSLTIWILLLLSALFWMIFSLIFGRRRHRTDSSHNAIAHDVDIKSAGFSARSLCVVIICVTAIIVGTRLESSINRIFSFQFLEVGPSISTSLDIADTSFKSSLFRGLSGYGPNNFSRIWNEFRPQGISSSIYYSDFEYSFSWVITQMTTSGIINSVFWLLFFFLLFNEGKKIFKSNLRSSFDGSLAVLLFVATIYLWAVAFLFVPSPTMVIMAFVLTGLLISSLVRTGVVNMPHIDIFHLEKKYQGPIYMGLMAGTLGMVYLGYFFTNNVVAISHFDGGLKYLENGKDAEALKKFEKAVQISGADTYHRAITELNLRKIDTLLKIKDPSDSEKREFDRLLINSLLSTEKATAYNKNDYKNWIATGRVFARVDFLPESKTKGSEAYRQALALNPNSSSVLSETGQYFVAIGEKEIGREYINKALLERPDDILNIVLMASLDFADNPELAKERLESIIEKTNDPNMLIRLGLLYYNNGHYYSATDTFQKILASYPDNPNIKYLLAISMAKDGNVETAIQILDNLVSEKISIPKLENMAKNLREGRDAFYDAGNE